MYLESREQVHITSLQVYPVWNSSKKHAPGRTEYTFEYPLGETALLWSEFYPGLYHLNAFIPGFDHQTVSFEIN